MATNFDAFISLINDSINPGNSQSLALVNEIINSILSTPDFFLYILQIYNSTDPTIQRLFPLIPSILKKFYNYFYSKNENDKEPNEFKFRVYENQYFSYIAQTHPEYFECMTNIILQNPIIDHYFCIEIWCYFFNIFKPAGLMEIVFKKMVEILDQCTKEQYQNVELLRKGLLLFSALSTLWRSKNAFPEPELENFLAVFFCNYFTPEVLENESLANLTAFFFNEATLFIRFSFGFYVFEGNCLIHYFNLIKYISKYGSELPPLQSHILTNLFMKLIKCLCDFANWIMSRSLDRYSDERSIFINDYFLILVENSIETALKIEKSFPFDTAMTIPRVILMMCWKIITSFSSEKIINILLQYFDSIFQLIYIYSNLPIEFQNQYIINPVIFYYSAYCPNYLTEFEPRTFSHRSISYLFISFPQKTLHYLLNSEPSPGLMYLIGVVAQKLYKIHISTDEKLKEPFLPLLKAEVFDLISNKIQQLLYFSNFEADNIILMSKSLIFLPNNQIDELLNKSTELINTTRQMTEGDTFSAEQQFLFTLACKLIKSLLIFSPTPETYNFFQSHIQYIMNNAVFCITEDAIDSVSFFYLNSQNDLTKIGGILLDLYCTLILEITNNFHDEIYLLNKKDSKIVESAQEYIQSIIGIQNIEIHRDNFIQFLTYCFTESKKEITEFMFTIMKALAFYAPQYYLDFLSIYFNFVEKASFSNDTDYFTYPFSIMIEKNTSDFLNWNLRDQLILFSISKFYYFFDQESKRPGGDFDNSYFLTTIVCLFILIPNLLNDQILDELFTFSIAKLNHFGNNPIVKYNCFNIITSIMHMKKIAISNEVMLSLLNFIMEGYAFRESERKRYLTAIDETRQLYSEDINQQIDNTMTALHNPEQIPWKFEQVQDWFVRDNIGINNNPPFGFN